MEQLKSFLMLVDQILASCGGLELTHTFHLDIHDHLFHTDQNGMKIKKKHSTMKELIFLLILTVNIFLTSCQPEGFQDLTPDDGHRDHYYFNTLKFEDALLV